MSAIKLIMKEAHPTLGTMGGHKLVGVRSIRLLTWLLQPVLEPCAAAAKSHDARDKFFTVAVSGFDPQAGAALAAEMPALESADAALSSIVVELAKALPAISSCKPAALSPFVPMPRSRAFSDTVQSATWGWTWARKQNCWRKPGAPLSQRVGCWRHRDPGHDRP